MDLVLENYAELERTILDMALDFSIFPGKLDALLEDATLLVNRRIVNLLTTARLYVDQVRYGFAAPHRKDPESRGRFREATSKEYDSVLGYRVMEALRNHAQHRNLPTHAITFQTIREKPNFALLRHGVVPFLGLTELEEDPDFKRSVLAELRELADTEKRVPILPFIRAYVESLGRVHECVRGLIAPSLAEADAMIQGYRAEYEKLYSEKYAGLAAMTCDARGVCTDREYLIDRPIKRRQALETKNQHLGSISSRYVSSRVDRTT